MSADSSNNPPNPDKPPRVPEPAEPAEPAGSIDPTGPTGLKKPTKPAPDRFKHSWKTHWSYGVGGFLDNFLTGAFSIHVFYYFEVELGVPGVPFMLVAFVLYGIWNMFNDPLAGYISDRPFGFVKRLGRRFPLWIVTAIPYSVVYLAIFTVPGAGPAVDDWVAFGWLLAMICLFDWCYSFWQTNWLALFPTKFRTQRERARVGATSTYAGQLGIALGMLLPSLFIEFNNVPSYFVSAGVVMVIGLGATLLMIPGMREDQELRDLAVQMTEVEDPVSFKEALGVAFRQKNFLAYAMVYLAQLVLMTLALGSLDYFVDFILQGEADYVTYIGAALLVGGLSSTPFWERFGKTHGNRKAYLVGSVAPALALVPFLFVSDLIAGIICAAVLGVCIGAVWTLMYPAYADVIDEIVLQTGKRNEGVYTGIRTIFGRLPFVIQAVVFSLVHHVTGFNEDPYAPLAQFGIRVHMVLVPLIFYLVGFVVMWRVHDLTPARVAEIKALLADRDL